MKASSIIPTVGSPKHNRPLRATHPTTLPITSPSPLPFMYNFTYSYAVLASSSSSTLFFSTFEPSPPYRGIVNNHSQSSWILLLFSFSLNYWNPHQDLKCGSKMGFDAVISHAFLVLSILRQHLRSSYKPIWNLTPFMKLLQPSWDYLILNLTYVLLVGSVVFWFWKQRSIFVQ